MTAADVTTDLTEHIALPGIEAVVLEASDDETYKSKKFGTVLGAVATANGDVGSQATAIAVTISGQEVTLRNSDLSDTAITLVLFGQM